MMQVMGLYGIGCNKNVTSTNFRNILAIAATQISVSRIEGALVITLLARGWKYY